ncbi:ThiF family adenylyltransferase [Microcoleus sp. F8-D3]|uniref:UBA/THIF-type NAD/FAD binding protein n=1 Tax=Phormidium nigroviride PCC 7112 TaxID=179408 RepID=K9VSB1_9CYAN|nr:ThiF family adenylyltransferase [Oscillatoria nigro-viridis]AFZ10459.1 UBA/THIF-type NAD/FAD binding protein [Oscillatoria nigro-viridis PCC 7112]
MSFSASMVLQEEHLKYLQESLIRADGRERAAYVLCGEVVVESDPWDSQQRRKYLSYEILAVPEDEIVSSSDRHITWKTNSFVRALKLAQTRGMTVALVHSHPGGIAAFSEQDDRNEPDLAQLAQNRNGPQTKLPSVIITDSGELVGRLWMSQQESIPLQLICVVGKAIQLHYTGRGQGIPSSVFHRQSLAFGEALTQDLSTLRVGVVGCGGTGSAVAMLLPKMGVRLIALFDRDVVEESNLNRLHGATREDAEAKRPKVLAVARSLSELGLGVQVKSYQSWIGDRDCRDALKSCDIVFGCTDDHAGRLLLNRFAYYYLTPVFDGGLAIEVSPTEPPEIKALDGRVTALVPNHTCLLCREVINPVAARDEALKRNDPAEYERRKAEAYVLGEGNPSPAVVLFTTGVAIMAIEELVHRLQGFRGENGAIAQRVRKFHLMTDRKQAADSKSHCPICGTADCWGKGDIVPFLDLVE